MACKKKLVTVLNDLLDPFREKRAYYESHMDEVRDIIAAGTKRLRTSAARLPGRSRRPWASSWD